MKDKRKKPKSEMGLTADQVAAMEEKHRQGYRFHPYPKEEVDLWGKEQVWGDEWTKAL